MATWRFFFVVVLLMFFLARRGDNTQSRGRSFMLMGQQLWGKHTCSRTNKNGRRTVKLMWLLHRGEKQVVPTVSFWRAHTEAVFIGCSPYLHTDDCCANVSKEEEEEMLVKIGADTQTFVSGSSWESWGSRGRLMFSDIHPSILIFDSIYIHAVCICVVFFSGGCIYICYRDVLSFRWWAMIFFPWFFFYSLACVASRVSYKGPLCGRRPIERSLMRLLRGLYSSSSSWALLIGEKNLSDTLLVWRGERIKKTTNRKKKEKMWMCCGVYSIYIFLP